MSERLVFENRTAFRQWLKKNHMQPDGLWLIFGKNKMVKTLSPEQALEEALCFGWIDGLIKSVDETQYVKYFSPRRNKSNWSDKNKRTAEKLIKSGQMISPGLKAIEKAKKNGSWNSQKRLIITHEDIEQLNLLVASNQQAAANFQKMSLSVKKQFTGFYLDAKKEDTRRQRLEKIIGLLEQNKKPM
jgi:uncharacterized protein YdeI (YjbR/CyaY-like superfamily)